MAPNRDAVGNSAGSAAADGPTHSATGIATIDSATKIDHISAICMIANAGTISTSVAATAERYTGLRPMRSDSRPTSGMHGAITMITGTAAIAAMRFETPTSFSR